MGWSGHGLYDGDGTQTCHYSFMKWAGWKDDDAVGEAMTYTSRGGKTTLTNEMKVALTNNIDKVLKKMPKLNKFGFQGEEDAIEWQMLLSLFSDNKLVPPKVVFDNGILATEYLLQHDCTWDFDNPAKRKAVLRGFIKRVRKQYPPGVFFPHDPISGPCKIYVGSMGS